MKGWSDGARPITAVARAPSANHDLLGSMVLDLHPGAAAAPDRIAGVAALGHDEIEAARKELGLEDKNFFVPDDVLTLLPANGGVVMVNWVPSFLSDEAWRWSADQSAEEARLKAIHRAIHPVIHGYIGGTDDMIPVFECIDRQGGLGGGVACPAEPCDWDQDSGYGPGTGRLPN